MGLEFVLWGNTLGQFLLYISTVAMFVVLGKAITWSAKKILTQFADKTETRLDDILLSLLEGPILFTIFIIALYYSRGILSVSENVFAATGTIISIAFSVNLAWYLIKLINGLITHYLEPLTQRRKTGLSRLLPLMKNLVSIIVFGIIGIMILDKLGYNINSMLAGLGVGGLALALAAKDMIGNFFGGITILIDKPFKIGDRIKVDSVDGYVRDIGLRSTRIETFGGTMITMPNGVIVDSITENISQEKQRRMVMTIGVEYGTSKAKLDKAKQIITGHVKKVKGLDHEQCSISFNEFADSSLNIRVQYWITKEGMDDYFGVKDALLTAIKDDFEKAKIEMAFPTRTIHVKK